MDEENKKKAFEYINDYNRDNYDRIGIMVKKGMKDVIKSYAKERGMSLSQFFVHCVEKEMEEMDKEN